MTNLITPFGEKNPMTNFITPLSEKPPMTNLITPFSEKKHFRVKLGIFPNSYVVDLAYCIHFWTSPFFDEFLIPF